MVRRAAGQVVYLPLTPATYMRLLSAREQAFDVLWKPIPNSPPEKAAQLFLRYTQDLGAEKGVMEALSSVVKVSQAQRLQAAAVLAKIKSVPAPKAPAKGAY